ncbi:SRPBCC family protein [Flavobacterium sp. '19STA2R22 D10 B1']|uniref:SRPBCC family protein n=1 Tax=Flavobacterium aerium TaxID=3037261 RepID=UPI00278C82AC|nr:GyrI-like domain-containing protein [Flavobacterium sp. '19STA2R22 D10 B1']
MKIAKYIFLLLLLAIIAFSVYVATQKGDFNIERSRIINAPRSFLFSYVNEYKNWEKWGTWQQEDPTIKYTYPEKTSGVGGSYTWIGKDGNGKMETVFNKVNDSIAQRIYLKDIPSDVYWKFKDTVGGTKVTWGMKGEMGFMWKAYAILSGGVDKMIGPMYEKGLDNLSTVIANELSNFNIQVNGLTLKGGGFYLQQTASCNIPDLDSKMDPMLVNIINFFKENKIPTAGAPFSIYHVYDTKNNAVTFSVAIPIVEQIFTTPGSDYTTGELMEFQALKTTLKGDYSHIQAAWDKANEYMTKNNLEEVPGGKFLEVYIKGPSDTTSPSEWITEIYIPVREKIATPPPVVPVVPKVKITPPAVTE